MLELLVFASTVVLGLGVASRVRSQYRLFVSPVIGVLAYTWLSFLLASLLGFNQNEIVAASLASLVIGAALLYTHRQKFVFKQEKTAFAVLAVALALFTLLHHSLLYGDSQGSLHGFLTDFNFHAAIAQTIAQGNFPPQYPFFLAGVPLSYYYFPHFYAAHYLSGGADLPTAFLLFSAAIAFICALVYLLARQLGFSKNASLLSPIVFLSISSLAFLQYFASSLGAGASLLDLLSKPEVSVNLLTYQNGFAFVGVLSQFLLSQASMPVGLALCLLALLLAVENKFAGNGLAQALVLLLLSIPFHAFLVIAFAAVITLQVLVFERRSSRWQFIPMAFSAGLLYLSFFSQKIGAAGSEVKLISGWMSQDKSFLGIVAFWLQNLFFLLLPIALGWQSLPKKLRQLVLCSVPLLVLVNFISFTPNPWDSGKLLLPFFAFASLAATHFIGKLFAQKNALKKLVAVAFLFTACFFTLFVVKTLVDYGSETIFDSGEVAACKQVAKLASKDSLFIVSKGYTCIGSMAGRKVFVAEPTQLDANALNASIAVSENEAMLQGNCAKIRRWGVTHFYDGGSQPLSDNANYSFFEQHGSRIWSDGKSSLYEISC